MSFWSPIVFGRTYVLDFRFLAFPEDFDQSELEWARRYINDAIGNSEDLRKYNKWSLFTNGKHCVIGVACMVEKLLGSVKDIPDQDKDITVDKGGRSTYVFAGYVTKLYQNLELNVLPYSETLEKFKDLSKYIESQWSLSKHKPKSVDWFDYNKFPYDKTFKQSQNINNVEYSPNLPNVDQNKVYLMPDNYDNRSQMWRDACNFVTNYPHSPISLCLGMPTKRESLKSSFLNASVIIDIHQPALLARPQINPKDDNWSKDMRKRYYHLKQYLKSIVWNNYLSMLSLIIINIIVVGIMLYRLEIPWWIILGDILISIFINLIIVVVIVLTHKYYYKLPRKLRKVTLRRGNNRSKLAKKTAVDTNNDQPFFFH